MTGPLSVGGAIRGGVGGVLMGLANLVPGISGGTMLLAVGIYPAFIAAVADVTTFRFRPRSILLLGTVAGSAAIAILFLAGVVRTLVIDYRWVMYSLFIGLTLGGVPLVWRLARPGGMDLVIGAAIGFALMVVMAVGLGGTGAGADRSYLLLGLSGLAGAAAMILPGVSGGYLLLLLGQYEVILGAIDQVKVGLLGDSAMGLGRDLGVVFDSFHVVMPVGVGVVIGVVGVSNLLRWTLERHRQPTLGVLLGLLLGAVVGLWPFQRGVPPVVGEVIRGVPLTASDLAALDPGDWPVVFFAPGVGQVISAVLLVGAGFGATLLIDRIGSGDTESSAE